MPSGLAVEGLEMGEVAIELPGVCADEGIAFSHLAARVSGLDVTSNLASLTWAAGSGPKKTALRDSIAKGVMKHV